MSGTVAIIDYGIGNIHSVIHALSHLGYKCRATRDPQTIRNSQALILPGVGAFGQAMDNLKTFGLLDLLNEEVLTVGKPILGICLGMQILGRSSEESPGYAGLGWLDFEVVSIPNKPGIKIPHVGWNTISKRGPSGLFSRLDDEAHFYFDHSYYADSDASLSIAFCDYGVMMPVIVGRDNIIGIQFHPEKSQVSGLKLLRNYFNSLKVEPC